MSEWFDCFQQRYNENWFIEAMTQDEIWDEEYKRIAIFPWHSDSPWSKESITPNSSTRLYAYYSQTFRHKELLIYIYIYDNRHEAHQIHRKIDNRLEMILVYHWQLIWFIYIDDLSLDCLDFWLNDLIFNSMIYFFDFFWFNELEFWFSHL